MFIYNNYADSPLYVDINMSGQSLATSEQACTEKSNKPYTYTECHLSETSYLKATTQGY